MVTDQFITPTLNTNLAGMVLEAADRRLCGVYNLAGATRISRYDYALELARVFELDTNLILPSRMEDMYVGRQAADRFISGYFKGESGADGKTIASK